MEIRVEKFKDYKDVEELTYNAFLKAGITEEIKEHILVKKIREDKCFIPELSLVAEEDGKILGHIMYSIMNIKTNEGKQIETLSLAPVSVHVDYQKQGIGSELIRYSLDQAKQLGYGSVIVVGHENYYPKFGFKQAKLFNLDCEFEVPDINFFALELKKNSLKNIKGTVYYPDVFKEI